jgi:hypothetical protein
MGRSGDTIRSHSPDNDWSDMRISNGWGARVAGAAALGTLASVLAAGAGQAAPTRTAGAQADVTPTIESVLVSGTGCPNGGTKPTIDISDGTLTASFTGYGAKNGGNTSITETRKNCQFHINATVPSGYTYTVSEASFTGSTSVAPGATTQQLASYYFSANASATTTLRHAFSGSKSFTNVDTADKLASLPSGPCSTPGAVNVNSSLQAGLGSDETKTSSISLKSATITLKAVKC